MTYRRVHLANNGFGTKGPDWKSTGDLLGIGVLPAMTVAGDRQDSPPVRPEWPFVARAAQIRAAVTELDRPGEPGVLLTGEAGVGKSRLLEAIADECRAGGMHLVLATATEAARRLPFTAIDALLPGPVGGGTADVFGAVARGLRIQAAGRPCLLAVDDVHHLDDASVALVQHLAATTGARILAATRPEALDTPAVLALRRRPYVRAMTVEALPRDAVADLVGSTLGGPVDGLTVDRLWRVTRGNPLFLRHLLNAGLASAALRQTSGVWRWTGRMRAERQLRDLVVALLDVLSPAEAAALTYVAHAEPVALDIIEALVDTRILEELERRSLVAVERVRQQLVLRVGHPLYGEVVRDETGGSLRERTYRDLARAALARRTAVAGDRLRAVTWQLAAGDRIAGAEVIRAATEALARCDPALAELLARHVGGPDGTEVLARALVAQDKAAEAEELLNGHPAAGQPRIAVLRAMNLFWNLRRPAEAAEVIRRCARDGPVTGELRVARLALTAFGGGGPAPRPAQLVDLSPAVSDAVVASVLDPLRAYLLISVGRPAYVADTYPAALVAAPRLWSSMRGAAVACRVQALALAGRLAEAFATAGAGYRAAVERAIPAEVALLAFELGSCEMWAGRPGRALPHFREARALLDEHVPFPIQVYVFAEYAACLAAVGRLDQAGAVLAEVTDRLPATSNLHSDLRLAALRIDAWSGRWSAAADDAARLGVAYRSAGRLTHSVEAFYYSARLRPSAAVATALTEVAQDSDSDLFRLFARHARAAADGDLDGLRTAVSELDRRGYRGLALEATLTAAGLATARGQRRGAAQLRVDGGRLHRSCDGYRPPWTIPTGPSVALTGRERQTCELAAAGLPDEVIAERLTLSRRTVANHLHRAYRKLGVPGRRDLPEALGLPSPGLRVDPLWATTG